MTSEETAGKGGQEAARMRAPAWVSEVSQEPALRFAVGEGGDRVTIRFDTAVCWLAMQPELAVDFAESVVARAREIARRQGRTLIVRL